jgi:tetraacyldisaccharide 4'-kinase
MLGLFDDKISMANFNSFIVVTGIANAQPMIKYLTSVGDVIEHVEYPDHFHYTQKDITKLAKRLKSNKGSVLVTTEKDAVKLRPYEPELGQFNCYYLPIKVEFLDRENEFLDELQKSIVLSD